MDNPNDLTGNGTINVLTTALTGKVVLNQPSDFDGVWVIGGNSTLEIDADAILMAKHGTKGVYDDDPRSNPSAEFLPELTHREAIERGLKVMDTTALSLCMDNNLPIYVFALAPGNIRRVLAGERIGTIISTPAKEER